MILSSLLGAMRAEILHMKRSPLLIFLTIIQAITFLVLVSLFGLTGNKAPTALINEDTGIYSKKFIETMKQAHHSFALQSMTRQQALQSLQHGNIVAIITIPPGFSNAIHYGETVPIRVEIDNVDTDLTDDIQRALPSAITLFGKQLNLPDIRVRVAEHDLLTHDTGFIPYLVVSALVLDGFIVAGILSAIAVAQEFETGTITLLALAPINPIIPLLGRMLVADAVAFLSMLLSVGVVIFGYGVIPQHPMEMLLTLIACVVIFGLMGVVIGVSLKRTLPVASLIFGLALPLYIDSGSLEPERFDGNIIWALAHLSPVYYAVGLLEHAFHGFQVTPEPIGVDFFMLIVWGIGMILYTKYIVRRQGIRC